MPGSEGARLVRAGAYQPADQRARRRRYLALFFIPFTAALLIFSPRYKLGKPDPTVEMAHRVRTWIAIIGALVTTIPFIGLDLDRFEHSMTSDLDVTCFAVVPIFLVSMALLVILTPARWRGDTIRQLLRPVLSTLVPYVIVLAITIYLVNTYLLNGQLEKINRSANGLQNILVALLVLWLGLFIFTATYLAIRHMFNAIDGNLLLPPVVTTVFGWWVVIQRLIWQSDLRPLWIDVLAAVLTAIVLTALSAWEISRLSRRGITLTSGPYPPPAPQPQPYPQPYR
jgi:hypothetical protein